MKGLERTDDLGPEARRARLSASGTSFGVRLFNHPQGLAVIVTAPAREHGELDALNAGTRIIPWRDLSRRAHELPHILDDCVVTVERALGLGAAAA